MRKLRRSVFLTFCAVGVVIIIGLNYLHTQGKNTVTLRDDKPVKIIQVLPTSLNITGVHQDVLKDTTGQTKSPTRPTRTLSLAKYTSNKTSLPVLPGIFTYLPHLKRRPDWLTPRIQLSKGRNNVSIVIGIPSIRRPVSIYIFDTLVSLFTGMNNTEKNDALVILSIAEPWNDTYVQEILDQLSVRFSTEISQGLLDVIVPRPEFYPDLSSLKLTLGDSKERVKWRSKQNLDYAFLIMHSWSRGEHYLQLEDDIKAVPGYITSMKKAIDKFSSSWFSIEFSTLGFIGRLFKSVDAAKMMEFLLMFFSSKPCDWLYDDFLQVKMCGHGEQWSRCIHKIKNIARSWRPSLFQHEGVRSSLGGHENKLKDSHFGADSGTSNPPVDIIITTLQTHSKYDIYSAYDGLGFFWGGNPKQGDIMDFVFEVPIALSKVYIVTGNAEHPKDIMRNATLEILPNEMPKESSSLYNKKAMAGNTSQERLVYEERLVNNPEFKNLVTNDTFFMIGEVDEAGIVSVDIHEDVGKIWVLRIRIQADSPTWVLIQKITLQLQ